MRIAIPTRALDTPPPPSPNPALFIPRARCRCHDGFRQTLSFYRFLSRDARINMARRVSQDGGQAVWCVSFNFVTPEHRNIFATVCSNKVSGGSSPLHG